ncbi:MAG: RagB/SusD family nutrient uptake outer membrane protein [Reichenbachiella sp.]
MKNYIILLFALFGFAGCSDLLEEEVFIESSTSEVFSSDEGARNAVEALYAKLRADGPVTANSGQRESWGFYGVGEGSVLNLNEVTTDEIYVHWASFGGFFQFLDQFTWLPNSGGHFDQLFKDLYEGIAISNNIITNINNPGISESVSDRIEGEALMARAFLHATALSYYGSIVIMTEDSDPLALPSQATAEQVEELIVADLTTAASLLPTSVSDDEIGRFTAGAAWATLARFQLNQKNWEEARDAAQQVVDLGVYAVSDSYSDIFGVDNGQNSEIIISIPCVAQPGIGNTFIAHTAESDYVSGGWGGHLIRNDFYATFDPSDTRRDYLLNSYTTTSGDAGSIGNGYMIMKYAVDPDRVGPWAGNDIVLHRYSEIILTLAESINEINGPTQESIDLINELRTRAFEGEISQLVQLGDFASKDALREHILAERGWELYAEGYRRDDLIRHNKFIEYAQDRGVAASDGHALFPIPQVEIDRNPNWIQNDY